MKTIYKSDGEMFDTPAAVDRHTGVLYINPKLWFQLTPFQRKFVKLHEEGHYVCNTDIEEIADAYAFDHLAGTEKRSLKQCIETLETILDPNRIGHQARMDTLLQRALEWDKAHPINKGSGSSNAEAIEAAGNIIQKANQGTTDSLQVVQTRETNSDNNQTMMYIMIIIAALLILKK